MAGADPGQIGVPGPNFELEPEIPLIIPATSIFPAQSGRAGKGGIRIMIRALISGGTEKSFKFAGGLSGRRYIAAAPPARAAAGVTVRVGDSDSDPGFSESHLVPPRPRRGPN